MWKPLFSFIFNKALLEKRTAPLAPTSLFLHRVAIALFAAIALTGLVLALGMAGYHYIALFPWIESFLNASMILSGMGQIDLLIGSPAKIFAGMYALFSGLFFAMIIGILFAPFIHRLYHRFHLDNDE